MGNRISSTSASPFGGAAGPGALERATVEAWVAAYRRAWERAVVPSRDDYPEVARPA